MRGNRWFGIATFLGLTVFTAAAVHASQPDTRSSEIRRPFPALFPRLVPGQLGVMYHIEGHEGHQTLRLSDGTPVSQATSINANTIFGMYSLSDRLAVGASLQWSAANLFHLIFGAQASARLYETGRSSLHFDLNYTGAFLVVGPSGGLQTYYRFGAYEGDRTTAGVLLGLLASHAFHYHHRVKREGTPSPHERYVGYMTSSGAFVGMDATASRWLASFRVGHLFRHALADEDGTQLTSAPGAFVALSVGSRLE